MRTFLFVLFCGICFLPVLTVLPGCHAKASREEGGAPLVSQKDVQKLLSKSDVLIVDNRPAAKFSEGHIPGAVNLPYFQKDDPTNVMDPSNLKQAASGKKTIIFYCSGMLRAFHALNAAREWGITAELFLYNAGFPDWVQQNGPIEK